jgi:predicted ATP-grasp superfamily ATP-dependent carboligase
LLDINSRVWGWHSLCARAGADFPFLTWQFVHGIAFDEVRARAGVRWVRMTTDVLGARQAFRQRSLSIYQYLKSFQRPLEFAIWARDDPVPALFEVPSLLFAQMKMRHAVNLSRRNLPAQNRSELKPRGYDSAWFTRSPDSGALHRSSPAQSLD